MWANRGRKTDGWLCLPPEILKALGMVCIAAGALLIIIFVPLKYWMALLGATLVFAGVWLLRS